jgi:hypothetical protein
MRAGTGKEGGRRALLSTGTHDIRYHNPAI